MYNLRWKMMVNPQPQSTTERYAPDLLDEEDERERVLLVVVRGRCSDRALRSMGTDPDRGMGTDPDRSLGSESPKNGTDELSTYAMNVSAVREVIRARAVTRVPGTPRVMSGLVNVRGMVVTVLDLAQCLAEDDANAKNGDRAPIADGVTEPRAQNAGSIVLLEHGGRLVGLAVDGVRDVRPLDDAGLVAERSILAESAGIKRGLASAGGEVVTLLDVAALLSRYLISSGET